MRKKIEHVKGKLGILKHSLGSAAAAATFIMAAEKIADSIIT